jgi:lipopolysaccharide transport system permease protein
LNTNIIESSENNWSEIISPQSSLFDLKLKEVWKYRDLLLMLVKRDFVATYKQTILGPLWFFIQPLLTTLTFMVIFGNIAKISTDGLPMTLFYMSGITLWNYFSDCFNKTSTVFRDNAGIFGKVYFPRLIMPLSIVVSNLVRLGIQLLMFLLFWTYFLIKGNNVHPNIYILLTPDIIFIIAILSLGMGMIISAMTTKYRDLVFLLSFGVQLMMYATPVIYPMSSLSSKYALIINLNPLSSLIETFRYAFTGTGQFSILSLLYSSVFAFVILVLGTITFNKVEKSFMDTV